MGWVPGARTPGSSTGLGPGGKDPRLLNWAAWGTGILTLRMPASHCPGCLWPLWTQSVTIIWGGGSEQEHPSKTEWWVPVALTLVRRSGAEELTLSDPEKHTQSPAQGGHSPQ